MADWCDAEAQAYGGVLVVESWRVGDCASGFSSICGVIELVCDGGA